MHKFYLIKNSPGVKKPEVPAVKKCDTQGGSQEVDVIWLANGKIGDNDNSGEFVLPSLCFTRLWNSPELSFLKFCHHHGCYLRFYIFSQQGLHIFFYS